MLTHRDPKRYINRRLGAGWPQRVAAITALLLELGALGFLVVLVLRRPLWAICLIALALAFVAASFLALTSTGPRRAAAAAAAVGVATAMALGTFVWRPSDGGPSWLALVALGALLVSVFLQRVALRVPPPSSPKLLRLRPGQHPSCRSAVLIVNPASGGGRAEAYGLVDEARRLGVEVVCLGDGRSIEQVAEAAIAAGADALGIASGDGTLGVAAGVAARRDVPLVCVPAGTRNHFALDLGLDRDDPLQALSAFVTGVERRIDYGTVDGRIFLNNVAFGVYAAVVEQPGYRDAKVETTLALLPELVAEGGPWFDLGFEVPGQGRVEQAALLLVSNNPYEVKGEFGRRRRLDGGELGVMAVDATNVSELVGLTALAAAGRVEWSRSFWRWSTEALEVTSGQTEVSAGVDGETVPVKMPVELRIVPKGLRVLVPRGTRVGLAEQHRARGGRYSGLLEVAFDTPQR